MISHEFNDIAGHIRFCIPGLQPETMKVVNYESATMKVTIGGGQGDFLLIPRGFSHSAATLRAKSRRTCNYESGNRGLGQGGGGRAVPPKL